MTRNLIWFRVFFIGNFSAGWQRLLHGVGYSTCNEPHQPREHNGEDRHRLPADRVWTYDPAAIRDFVQTAEDLGYTHILAYDHILGANPVRPGGWSGPYTHRDPFYEPFLLFSYMAALTHTLEFVTGIIILPPARDGAGRQASRHADVLCDGRLRLGVATGWKQGGIWPRTRLPHPGQAAGRSKLHASHRPEPLVTVDDGWHTIDDVGHQSAAVQRPIPIWFGGHADAGCGGSPPPATAGCPTSARARKPPVRWRSWTRIWPKPVAPADIGIEPRIAQRDGDLIEGRHRAAGGCAARLQHDHAATMRGSRHAR
ncbi:MAG: LLM class flavin-dependent oxidoreductase [Caldilineaceae bacterium]